MYYLYLLRSLKDKKFYIGYTSDLKIRYKQHNKGEVKSTKHRRPLALIYYEAYSSGRLAERRETNLKKYGSAYTSLLKRLNLK
ncbi:MAG: GIY-YIG nuclease family protein [Patescibacteria group bacterium]